jgi:uncharacterized membrane protein
MDTDERSRCMSQIQESVDVEVPVSVAYNQWTQFEEFPEFMGGVEEVRQLDATHLHWVAEIAGVHREWDARITEQIPDERVAWTNTDGVTNGGVVTFHRLAADRTRVMLQLDFEPDGLIENVGDKFGFVAGQTRADLERFRDFITTRGAATGEWRGEVRGGDSPVPASPGSPIPGATDIEDPFAAPYADPNDPRTPL